MTTVVAIRHATRSRRPALPGCAESDRTVAPASNACRGPNRHDAALSPIFGVKFKAANVTAFGHAFLMINLAIGKGR